MEASHLLLVAVVLLPLLLLPLLLLCFHLGSLPVEACSLEAGWQLQQQQQQRVPVKR